MDNQKSNEGNARHIGSEGSGSSMGKDLSQGSPGDGQDRSAENLHRGIDKAVSSAHVGVDKVAGALTGANARMDEKSRQLGEAYKHFAETGRSYVRTSPATSVLVAVGAGYVLSKLLGRRRK
jgi:ElaB/YqjD/DUF883 family membrane-anchored ribosome-binding protein